MKKVILSIDGGGVRGLNEAMQLHALEVMVRKHSGNPKAFLADYVDIISGASTGGIIAAMLACPMGDSYRYDTKDLVNFYKEHCYEIFNESKKWIRVKYGYSPKALEKYLHKYLNGIEMSKLHNHVIIPVFDIKTNTAVFFSNVKSDTDFVKFKVEDVLRMTSSAPTYFPIKIVSNGNIEIIGVDGGMVANNTSICDVAKEVNYSGTYLRDMCVINFGSGSIKPDVGNPKKWWIGKWGTKLPLMTLDANVGLVRYQLKRMKLGKLFLIDIPRNLRNYSSDMADASPENMKKMEKAALQSINVNRKELDSIAKFLVKNKSK